jgi:hypothetical protein
MAQQSVDGRKKTGTEVNALPPLLAAGVLIFLLALASGCAVKGGGDPTPEAATPPVIDTKALKPGLAVLYRQSRYQHVDEMSDRKRDLKNWRPGKPIAYIDHQFGSGFVFGSGLSSKVGVRMTGFIHLAKAGQWEFKAYANDGIRVTVGNTVVVNDPSVHFGGDRFSNPKFHTVEEAGWYPVLIKYFQKKGTAALSLYWKAPDASDFSVIPAEAYAHLPEQNRYAGN